jgi:hypothetical protein
LNANDANIIRQSEIAGNIVNECGRTLLAGNSTYLIYYCIHARNLRMSIDLLKLTLELRRRPNWQLRLSHQ